MKQSLLATAITLVFSGMALADGHMASGTDISKAMAGNTVQGSMMDAGAYTEFYAADGICSSSRSVLRNARGSASSVAW